MTSDLAQSMFAKSSLHAKILNDRILTLGITEEAHQLSIENVMIQSGNVQTMLVGLDVHQELKADMRGDEPDWDHFLRSATLGEVPPERSQALSSRRGSYESTCKLADRDSCVRWLLASGEVHRVGVTFRFGKEIVQLLQQASNKIF